MNSGHRLSACPGPFANIRESRLQNHCVNQSTESRTNDCTGILYSDSEFMDLTPFLILAPPVHVQSSAEEYIRSSKKTLRYRRGKQQGGCRPIDRSTGIPYDFGLSFRTSLSIPARIVLEFRVILGGGVGGSGILSTGWVGSVRWCRCKVGTPAKEQNPGTTGMNRSTGTVVSPEREMPL